MGDDFADEVENGIWKIISAPLAWRVIEDDVRRFLINRFPSGIYYTIENDVVVIWAVKHLHRDPDYWQQRRG
ncbi:MAG: type II toxin-antitoxin system RelE/ParE family toxin [Verrucomicrobia bacterium]|nr:type II toxin-antitoxin system RelE/ParE family toxin [Verrucomicrobiota bacterium]